MKYEEYIEKYGDKFIKGTTYRYYKTLLSRYNDRIEFEDVLEICNIYVARALPLYNESLAVPNTFINKVIKNACYDIYKNESREKRKVYDSRVFFDEPVHGEFEDMSLYECIELDEPESFDVEDFNDKLSKILQYIDNPKYRDYFEMYCKGYSIQEICKKYGTAYKGTKTILSRIRVRLRKYEKEIRSIINQ